MASCSWVFLTLAIFVGVASPYLPSLLAWFDRPLIADIEANVRWALGETEESDIVESFRIPYDHAFELSTKERLRAHTNVGRQLGAASNDWTYGINHTFLNEVLNYWAETYSWKQEVESLNTIPQFTTRIQGLNLHFWHLRVRALRPASGKITLNNVVLMLHGWPGSVVEFRRVALTLQQQGFDVVVPSLPGYGWSERGDQAGLCPVQVAHLFCQLMSRLGYKRYFVQGGDWGSLIAMAMSRLSPTSVRGLHLNMFPVGGLRLALGTAPLILPVGGYAEERKKMFPVGKFLMDLFSLSGYFHIQATKPHTLGVALSDSPAGLAAWILEKFAAWTDCGNPCDPRSVIAVEELLTNINVYWSTGSITSSMLLYREFFESRASINLLNGAVSVPVGLLEMPAELAPPPSTSLQWKFLDIVSHTRAPRGGHFAAMEQPDLFVKELLGFIAQVSSRSVDA